MKTIFFSLLSGFIFGVGLWVSGMTQPAKVIGFLDFLGEWQWDLMGVMGGALLTHMALRPLIIKRSEPLLGGEFPTFKNRLDLRLMGGAALFGVGWGLGGFCPGPALVSVVTGAQTTLIFVLSMIVGMVLVHLVDRWSKME